MAPEKQHVESIDAGAARHQGFPATDSLVLAEAISPDGAGAGRTLAVSPEATLPVEASTAASGRTIEGESWWEQWSLAGAAVLCWSFLVLALIVTLVVATLTRGIPLPLGVVGHEGSTVIVVLNGLRLLRTPRTAKQTERFGPE